MNTVPEAMEGGLPGGIADPLHFPEAMAGGWLPALLLLALLWLLSRWWSRQRSPTATAPSLPAPAPPASPDPLIEALVELRTRHLAHKTYRQGCHELAALLRSHFERLGTAAAVRLPWTRLTAREIQQRAGDLPAARLLSHLAGLRFGRAEPGREELEGACQQALHLVGSQGRKHG